MIVIRIFFPGADEFAGERKSTIVFCVHIAHVKALTQKFRDYGIDAQYITSDTILQVRRERLAAFKKGEFRVLVNCGVFTEVTISDHRVLGITCTD